MKKVARSELLDWMTYTDHRDSIRSEAMRAKDERRVHVGGTVFAGPADNYLIVALVPFENRTWPNAEFLSNLCGNGNLTLRGELGLSERHRKILPR